MYLDYFGLKTAPFSIAPDPRFLFMSERHREALAHLVYGVDGGGGFVLLSGEIGAGKTTVCRCFLEQIPPHCDVAYIFNPKLTVTELLQSVCEEFRIAVAPGAATRVSVKDYVDPLNRFLLASHAAGRHCVLIIDEAQNLSADVLEQLRLLTNLETHDTKLLQIILIGQPELRDVLAQPALEQLAQRVVARFHLQALSASETIQYVEHRLAVAGWTGPLPFEGKALALIHALSRGVPRRINLLCDRALLGAYGRGLKQVSRALVQAAAQEVFDVRAGPRWWRVAWRRMAWPLGGALSGLLLGALWTEGAGHGPRGTVGDASALLTPVGNAVTLAAAGAASTASGPDLAGGVPPADRSASAGAAVLSGEASGAGGVQSLAAEAALTPGPVTLVSDEAAAWQALAGLWRAAPLEGPPCAALAKQGLGCWRSKGNLTLLAQLDRPTVLWLEQGASTGWVLLTGMNSTGVSLLADGVERQMPLAQLATLWRGDMATLWRMPPGYQALLTAGARGPAVDRLLTLLAQANREPAPAGPTQVNPAVMARVSAFQVSEGLTPDGVAGPTTFMLLHRRVGLDEPRLGTPR
jgi:general secretion pathway protein A